MADHAQRKSLHIRTKTISVRVHNHSIGMNHHWNDVFLNFNGILELSLTVEELLKASNLVINDFLLCFQFSLENDVSLTVAHERNWTLAKSVDEDAVALSKFGRILIAHACASICLRML